MAAQTLPGLIFETENANESAPAVLTPHVNDISLTRPQLKQASQRLADLILAKGKAGDNGSGIDGQPVVALALPNGIGFVCTFLGLVSRGVVAAPLNPAYTVPEFEFYLSDAKASVLVVDSTCTDEAYPGIVAARKLGVAVCTVRIDQDGPGSHQVDVTVLGKQTEKLQDEANVSNDVVPVSTSPTTDSIALILHTSGTTGKPKAVPLSHANLCHGAQNVAQACCLGPGDRGYLIQVLFHIHGIVAGLLAPLAARGSVVVPNKFDANVAWHQFVEAGCSWLSGTPSALQILLHAPQPGPDLRIRFLRSCSAPLLPSTFADLRKVFGCPVLEAYAMTENAHQMATNSLTETRPGYVGKASGSVSLSIYGDDPTAGPLGTDVQGEICITGGSVMRGYLDNPEANAKTFFVDSSGRRWLRTGDIGILDSQAGRYLRIVGRKSEIINRGGEKISPPEVDEAIILCAAPHIREAACFAVPDEFFGQEVEAAVVLAKDAPQELHDEAVLQRRLEERLALFKIPKRIHFFEDKIPKGPTGKIQRAQLCKKLARRPNGEVNGRPVKMDAVDLSSQISTLMAQDLRVAADKLKPEVTLLELGADSMNLTRLLGNVRRLGCSLAMSDLMLNPTVQEVIDMCVESYSSGKGDNVTGSPGKAAADDVEPPAPFSLLSELIKDTESPLSLDEALSQVAKQTGLTTDQLEDVLPLTPEAKWFHSVTLTDQWGMKGTAASFVTIGATIKESVDIERLKWALEEVAKVEPLPRSFFAQLPSTEEWLQVIAKPNVANLNWEEWSAPSKGAMLERLQREHDAERYTPGCRASKYLLVSFPNDQGETCRSLFFSESHIVTDNTSRSRLRDNVIRLYEGLATIENLPQKPLPTGILTRDLLQRAKASYSSKIKFWKDDELSHGVSELPPYIPPLGSSAGHRISRVSVDNAFNQAMWTGDLTGLTLAMGMTAPTTVQVIVPLALAVYEYQGTHTLPKAVCFGYGTSSRNPRIPNIDQSRGLAAFPSPFRFPLSLARQSLWMHCHQAALKTADTNTNRLLVESLTMAKDVHVIYNWREVPAGSLWSQVIEDGPEQFLVELPCHTTVNCMRMGINQLFMVDGEGEAYKRWRKEHGFPVSFIEVLQRCLTFMCERKDELATLTLNDLVETVASSFDPALPN
ncbi:hypothetical protein KVR01_009482 [Diaporthe batatas]|uniref:uncharacterized protein n=1 Tax=Diaporthe batatas TaxID=748121 RepID=UPI001D04242F|nr:uncharacterized protein KVR01_009482 [Diaporthe batatas]KAG8161218.1 hypothetical protein KVR01_009482 [Diaporthe batatas]